MCCLVIALLMMITTTGKIYAEGTGIPGLDIIDGSIIIDKNQESQDGETTFVPEENLVQIPTDQTGSISLTLSDTEDHLSKANVQFGVVKVASIEKGSYVLTEMFKDSGVNLNNIKNANELELTAEKLSKNASAEITLMTDTEGHCALNDLEVGVYLFYAIDTAEYDKITPFIIAIPTYSDTDKMMLYDVTVIPKHSPYPEMEVVRGPNTGTENHGYMYMGLAGGCLIAACVVYGLKKKNSHF